jgi:glycosyltransferase involved in cell wall biosynthesis
MSTSVRIAAVAPGPPLDAETFSGTSRSLLQALERRGALTAAVDGRPTAFTWVEKAACYAPDRERWRQWYNIGASPLSPAVRAAMSAIASTRLRRSAADANVVLQLTGWFDPERARSPERSLRAAYHDGNVAAFLRRPDLRIDPRARRTRAALAYERRLHDHTDLILPMSEWLRRSFIEDFDQDPAKVVAVGAGSNVRVSDTLPDRDFTRMRLLFVGKQFERKGGPQLLRAFAALRARQPEAELWIVGPGDLRLSQPGVHVHGLVARDAVTSLYEQATAFALPALYDPFPTAVREAMAYRLPCVTSDAGALPEMVVDGETGYTVAPGDADALAERLLKLADDPSQARAFGDAGRRRFEERFTWDAVAGRILEAIEQRL